jgi:hypothetical protein
MPDLAKHITAEEAAEAVLKKLASADPGNPQTLSDYLTEVGLFNPYKRALALRLLRAKLKPPYGSHAHITNEKRWAYERERWAKDAGLNKGKVEGQFDPETDTTRALAKAVEESEYLPDIARSAVGSIRQQLALRANRKLNETSAELIGDGVQELMHEMEVQGRLLEEKEARILQAERHAEDLRRTNERLLAIMEQLAGKATDGAIIPASPSERDERDKGGARRSN